ncbi:MAG: hypothetical protein O7E57_16585 [Gammaproteobacteria bacterium]|nr:hypothetical protein [Gammaproteobacteria bacterium]
MAANNRPSAVILLSLCVSTWAATADSPVSIGDYVVLYAQLKNCPEFPGIVDVRKVDDSEQFFLSAGPIAILGSSTSEIQAKILRWIAEANPDRKPPRSLRIEVLRSEQEYLMIRDQLLASKKFLSSGAAKCEPRKAPNKPIDPGWHHIADASGKPYEPGRQADATQNHI